MKIRKSAKKCLLLMLAFGSLVACSSGTKKSRAQSNPKKDYSALISKLETMPEKLDAEPFLSVHGFSEEDFKGFLENSEELRSILTHVSWSGKVSVKSYDTGLKAELTMEGDELLLTKYPENYGNLKLSYRGKIESGIADKAVVKFSTDKVSGTEDFYMGIKDGKLYLYEVSEDKSLPIQIIVLEK